MPGRAGGVPSGENPAINEGKIPFYHSNCRFSPHTIYPLLLTFRFTSFSSELTNKLIDRQYSDGAGRQFRGLFSVHSHWLLSRECLIQCSQRLGFHSDVRCSVTGCVSSGMMNLAWVPVYESGKSRVFRPSFPLFSSFPLAENSKGQKLVKTIKIDQKFNNVGHYIKPIRTE